MDAAWLSVNETSMFEGASKLWDIVDNTEIPIGARIAAALFATVAQVEMDEPEVAVARLRALAEVLRADIRETEEISPSKLLVLRVLLIQLALREYETSGRTEARHILAELRELDHARGRWDRFPVSNGVSWDSARVQKDAFEATRVHERMLTSSMESFEGDTWIEVVKARAPWSDTRIKAHAASRDSQFLKQHFQNATGNGTKKTLWASGDPVLREGWESLLAAELSANLYEISNCRAALGRLRILTEPTDASAIQDGLRLLRIAGDRESLEGAIHMIQSQGPTRALQGDATVVRQRSSFPRRVGQTDLMVISAAANFMEPSELNAALEGVFSYLQTPSETSARSFRDERSAWTAVSRLLPDSDADDRVASEALRYLQESSSLRILEDTFQGLVEELNWNAVSAEVQEDWRVWARQNADQEGARNLAAQASCIGLPATSTRAYGALSDYYLAVQLANYHPDDAALSDIDKERAIKACLDGLLEIRNQAGSGSMSFGGHDLGLLSLILADKFNESRLRDAVTDLLIDPAVDGYYKKAALDRLSASYSQFPKPTLRRLRSNWRSIADSPHEDSPFSSEQLPYFPEAIRLGAHLKVLSRDEAVGAVTEMAGGGSASSRKAACATLPFVAREFDEPEWGQVLLLQLSRDSDSVVRALAGHGLALVGHMDSSMSAIVYRRLIELLEADGILIPLRTLHGFQIIAGEGLWNFPSSVEAQISLLADQSRARVLRKASWEVQRLLTSSRSPQAHG
ncbi:hypothetical protein Q9R30_02995 [Arthrobacter sp. AB6]|uniref:hypothetical protein n=1 Tax=Arthrobacter sp. AB6 TaxID=2962570 RepID=UPI00288137ED|nr:hypothetical protein [Arthrobacter sp. AB6]MDT0194317.1 hypothetical protein [Arthrobacter sp. AB6]